MQSLHIYIVEVVVIINAVLIIISMSSSPIDDSEFYNDDGDHIYYDRRLIRHKATTKIQK